MLYGLAVAAALVPFVFLTVAMRRADLRLDILRLQLRRLLCLYCDSDGAARANPSATGGRDLDDLHVARGVGGRHLRLFRWQGGGTPPHVAGDQSEKNLGRRDGLGSASVIIGTLWIQHAPGISAALLRVGLIERRDGMCGLEQPQLWPIILLSAVVNLAAQLGDLVESLIKRGAGVKDSGTILPGHGGMLDRIDAMLFAVPVVWAYGAWRLMQ